MVKRSLIAIALLALVATMAFGADGQIKKDGSWPTVYVALDLCTMPVVMDVGMYVQIIECDKKIIKLVQVDCASIGQSAFPCYSDCEDFDIRANFTAVLGSRIDNKADWVKGMTSYYDGESTVPGDGVVYKRTVCVDAWEAEIWTSGPGDEVKVADLTITVKPE